MKIFSDTPSFKYFIKQFLLQTLAAKIFPPIYYENTILSDPPAKSSPVCINMLVENDSKRNCTLLWVIVSPIILTDTFTV